MNPAPRPPISDAELEILRALWEQGPGIVRDIQERLVAEGCEWQRSTVITLLQRLERKGYVVSDRSSHAFVFRAAVTRDDLVHQRMLELADELCDGEAAPLLLAFAERQRFTADDLQKLRRMIDQLAAKQGGARSELDPRTLWAGVLMNTILWWLAENTLVTLCLLPVVWLLCRVLRHRPAEQHLLWLMLLVKLLTPPIFESPWTLPAPSLLAAPAHAIEQPALASPESSVATAPQRPLAAQVEMVQAVVSAPITELVVVEEVSPSDLITGPVEAPPLAPVPVPAEADRTAWIATALFFIWMTGCVIAFGCVIRRLISVGRVLRCGVPASHELEALVQKEAFRLRLRWKDIRVQIVSGARGPFIACIGRPCLVWPQRMSARESIVRSAPIIAHELAHLKRRDHYIAWLELIASIAWWWNPLFRLIRRRLHETREMACDAMALEGAADRRRDYAELLLEITSFEKQSAYAAPAFGAGNIFRGSLQRRLEMVFNEKAKGRVTAAGLVLVMALGLLAIPRWSIGQDPPATDPPAAVAVDVPGEPELPARLTPPAAPAAPVAETPHAVAQPPAVDAPPSIVATVNEIGGENGAVVKLGLGDGQSVLCLRAIEDGTLSIEVERDGQIVERHMLPFVILRPGDVRATTRETRRGVGQAQYATPGRAVAQPRIVAGARGPAVPGVEQIRSIQVEAQPAAAPAGIEFVRSANAADLDLLKLDCELAQLTVEKRKIEFDEAKETEKRAPGTVPATKIRLLELSIREAELQLRKCQLQLEAAARQQQRQAEPEGAAPLTRATAAKHTAVRK